MNKNQFIEVLETHLSGLNKEERDELITDYKDHFMFGEQNGKSEEEVVRELGDPIEIAKEALGERYVDPSSIKTPVIESSRSIFSFVMLFFLNIMLIIPIGVSIWVVWISLVFSSAVITASPILAAVDYFLHGIVLPAKWFLSIGLTGVGILLGILTYYAGRALSKLTVSYFKWNFFVVKGRK